jgi:recombination protein RecA
MGKTKTKSDNTPADALELVLTSIEKQFGKGTVITGQTTVFPEIARIPSGSIALDRALAGGYAKGRIIEILGPESSGKTTLALHAIAECQKQGGICAFIDAEHALDVYYAAALGVDIDTLLISQPDNGEQALNIAEMLVRSGAVDLIVIDSVSALVPRVEIEGEVGDTHMGLQARLMSQAMRMLVGPASKTDTAVMFVNQIRMKIGVMFGSPETTSGGNALKFYASQRLDIRRIQTLSQGEDKTGIRTRVKVAKNKVGAPFKMVEFNIMFGQGIDWAMDLLDLATSMGFISKSGSWYAYKEENIGQGTTKAAQFIRDNPQVAAELQESILHPPIPQQ